MVVKKAPCQSDKFAISTTPDKVIAITNSVLGDEYVPFSIEVKNNLCKPIFYKVKVTSNYLFRIAKPSGIIANGETKKLEINIRPKFGVPKNEDEHHVNLYYTFKPDDVEVPKTGHFSVRSAWREIEARKGPIEFRMFAMRFEKAKPEPKASVEPQEKNRPLNTPNGGNQTDLNEKCFKMWMEDDGKSTGKSKCDLDQGKGSCEKPSSKHDDKLRSWILHRSYGICCDHHCEQFSDDEIAPAGGTEHKSTLSKIPRRPKAPGERHTLNVVLRMPRQRAMRKALYNQLLDKHGLKSNNPTKLP